MRTPKERYQMAPGSVSPALSPYPPPSPQRDVCTLLRSPLLALREVTEAVINTGLVLTRLALQYFVRC